MAESKIAWIAAVAIVAGLGYYRYELRSPPTKLPRHKEASTSSAKAAGSTGSAAQASESAPEMVNENRALSPADKRYAILGASFAPMKKPCSLSRSGHEDVDECEGDNGVKYSFSVDHKNIVAIARNEQLPESVSFEDVVGQLSAKYGSPASRDQGGRMCQALWGNTSGVQGVSFRVESVDATAPCLFADKGLAVRYHLADDDAYNAVSKAVQAREAQERASAVANHKF